MWISNKHCEFPHIYSKGLILMPLLTIYLLHTLSKIKQNKLQLE